MLDLWWLFFAVLACIGLTMWLRDEVDWAPQYQDFDITDTNEIWDQFIYYKHNLILISSILAGIFVGRIFVLTLCSVLYFLSKGPDMELKMKQVQQRAASIPSYTGIQSGHGSIAVVSDVNTDLEEGMLPKKKAKKKGKKKK
mmetsp:Transcript_21946/g.16296  ORF Transcript_21946/g.16296 Transcript_21946/m.16296 type:complete len:142 (+) Transcript_21946:736-1161(+)